MSILVTSLLAIVPLVASNPIVFATKPPPRPKSSVPRILAGAAVSVLILGIIVFFCICCRRSHSRNASVNVFKARPTNPADVEMPTIRNIHIPPVRMPSPRPAPPPQPPHQIQFPPPSLPPHHSLISPAQLPPPLPPRRSLVVPTPYDSAPNRTLSPDVSSLSRGPPAHVTVHHIASSPTISSPSTQTAEPHSSQTTTSIAGSSSRMPLRDEMAAYQNQLRPDESGNNSDGPSNDPPPKYSVE